LRCLNKNENNRAGDHKEDMKIKTEIEVFEVKHPKGHEKRLPRGMAIFAWVGNELFIPCGAAGISEDECFMICAYDCVATIDVDGITLIPESFARKERPDLVMVYDAIRATALKCERRGTESQ
jgi:hypothetical protein